MVIGDNWTRTSIHSQYAIASFFCLQPQIEKKKEKRSTAFNWICIFVSLFFRIKKSAEIFQKYLYEDQPGYRKAVCDGKEIF